MQNVDKRKNKRIPIQARATIGIKGLFSDGLLMDFSKKGLRLLLEHNEFIDKDEKLNLIIETSPTPTTVQGVIKWVHKLNEDKLLGCAVGMELVDFDISRHVKLLKHK